MQEKAAIRQHALKSASKGRDPGNDRTGKVVIADNRAAKASSMPTPG